MNNEQQNQHRFNPNQHLLQLKSREGSKDYLPVQWRLVWFRESCSQGTIDTQMVHLDTEQEVMSEAFAWNPEKRRSEKMMKTAKGIAIFKATVTDGNGATATGYGSESAADFADYIEKAETKAIGRALAALGYGTQFAPELEEGNRIVDAPVERTGAQQSQMANTHPTSSVRAPLPKELCARSNQLFGQGKFEQVKVKALKSNIPDDNLTPEECAKVKEYMDAVEASRKRQQAQAS